MESDILFSEKQGFRQWWLWVLLIDTRKPEEIKEVLSKLNQIKE